MAIPPAYHESLPYIDPKPTPDALAAARALIAAEANPAPTHPSLLPLRSPRFSPAIAAELSRIAAHQPSQPLSLARYEAQDIPPPDSDSLHALRTALHNSCLSQSYLESRAANLSLLEAHGTPAWLLANYSAESLLASTESFLAQQRRAIDVANARRLARQQSVADEVRALNDAWRKGVARVLETELAVENLRQQIRDELRARTETQKNAPTPSPHTQTQEAPA